MVGSVPPVLAVGLTGIIASGKEEVASFFVTAGFELFSLSDRVREEATRQGFQPPSRTDLQRIGNELRRRAGPGVLAYRTLQKIEAAGMRAAVIDGFRNPHEVTYFQQRSQFYLVAVDAPSEVRFERLLQRQRPGDPRTLEEFSKWMLEIVACGEPEEGQQVGACLQLAQFTIQ